MNYNTDRAIELTGVSRRKVYFWIKNSVMDEPSGLGGSGSRARWTREEVAILHAVGRLNELVPLTEHLRRGADAVRAAMPLAVEDAWLVVPKTGGAFITRDLRNIGTDGYIVNLGDTVELYRNLASDGRVAA